MSEQHLSGSEEGYRSALRGWVEGHPDLIPSLALLNKVLTWIGYIAYPLLLGLLIALDPSKLIPCIVVPAAGFLCVSVFRYLYNSPRPYEQGGVPPLIPKDTKGKSFPSRHTFCMFMIACCWFLFQPLVGILLMIAGCIMGMIRVACGVHFPRDVISGAILAIGFALIGFSIIQ